MNAPTRLVEPPLAERLRAIIMAEGPVSIAHYMSLCLSDKAHGYYMTRDPLGAAGDFTTAPEISQMFGELLGLWSVAVWQQIGSPALVRLVELGPGRGTLMADALRAAALAPAFGRAVSVHLVETSPFLRARQAEALATFDVPVAFHDATGAVPDGPAIAIANEFFDALPVFQAQKAPDGWRERVIGLAPDGRLQLGLAAAPMVELSRFSPAAPNGTIYEWRDDAVAGALACRVAQDGGAALIIDYGHAETGFGDTWQAVRRHAFADPLERPGEADLTAHVDFAALKRAAERAGARVHGPVTQGDFLRRLGIAERAARLRRDATDAQGSTVDAAVSRLTDRGPGSMGALFKVLAFAHPGLGALPGFDGEGA